MFKDAERALSRELKTALGIEVLIGIPEPEIVEGKEPPFGSVYLSSCRMVDLIPDGVVRQRTFKDGTVEYTEILGEAEMEMEFLLISKSRRQLDDLTLSLLKHFNETPSIGEEGEFVVGTIRFRDELPSPERERKFVRIFTIPVIGPVTRTSTGYSVREIEQQGTVG